MSPIKQFLISTLDSESCGLLNDIVDNISLPDKLVISPEVHFTVLYMPNTVDLEPRIQSCLDRAIQNIEYIEMKCQKIRLVQNYLMMYFQKNRKLKEIHDNFMSCMTPGIYCENADFTQWDPHMVISVLDTEKVYADPACDLTDQVPENLLKQTFSIDRLAYTQLRAGGFNTVKWWQVK